MKRVNQNRLCKVSWWWGCYGGSTKAMAFFLDRDNVALMKEDGTWCLREMKYDKPSK
jgi:hypothetical protein